MPRFTPSINLLSLLPIVLVTLLFPYISIDVVTQWFSGEQDNAHALPAFLAAIYIAVTSTIRPSNNKFSSTLLLAAILVLLVGNLLAQLASITVLGYAFLLSTMGALYLLFFKVRDMVTIGLILLMCALALPVWDSLLEPLVVLASIVVTYLLSWFNIAILIEGNSITTPFGRILIAEGCSGIRYFLISIILASVVSKENHYSLMGTIAALFVGVAIGLIANWIRILLLVLIGYYTGMESSLMQDHEVFGWVVFAVTVVPLIYFAPQLKPSTASAPRNPQKLAAGLVVVVFIFAVLHFGATAWFNRAPASNAETAAIQLDYWTLRDISRDMRTLPIHAQDRLTWYYSRPNDLYVGLFNNKKTTPNDKLVPYISQSLVTSRWNFERNVNLQLDGFDSQLSAQIIKSSITPTRYVRLQLFNVGSNWTTSYSQAKLEQIPALLTGNNNFNYFLLWKACTSSDCVQAVDAISNELRSLRTDG